MTSSLYDQAKALGTANGYVFGGIDDGCPFWSKKLPNGKYAEMILLPEDLEPKNFAYMAEHRLMRTPEWVKKYQAKYRKQLRKEMS